MDYVNAKLSLCGTVRVLTVTHVCSYSIPLILQSGPRTTGLTYACGRRRIHLDGSLGSRITRWGCGICICFLYGSQNIQQLLPCTTLSHLVL